MNFAVVGAAGLAVGLPEGNMGNSEVGHLTIGSGAVDYQVIVKINKIIADGLIGKQPALAGAFKAAVSGTGRLHLFGLLSDGGVHSHEQHLYAIVAAAKAAGVNRTFLHVCMDGRDTPPTSGAGYMEKLEAQLAEIGHGEVSSIFGRYWAMDRDKRWERVKKGYDVMCRAPGQCATTALGGVKAVLEARYAKEPPEKDEFIEPTGLVADGGIADGDVYVCFNFRSDRAREMFECVAVKPKFETGVLRKPAMCVQMTEYSSAFTSPIVFPPTTQSNGLCETVSKLGLTQFHVAETEKYAHVTFFFNGGREEPFEGEVRELKDSPKVATYDLEPKMAAEPVADAMVREIEAGVHTLLICNLAPPDMVGHTGFFDKAVEAAAHTDTCIGKIHDACAKAGVGLFIVADHGNCETMMFPDGSPMTSHSTTAVPFVAAVPVDCKVAFNRKEGGVADVAPTMLTYMGIDVPKEMTGISFF
uniref:phosphoglycerate mutase (2,3-diphosphoglycerate-independent) n=1 Tax=Haptolina ericina TaxID=156174 RepID=A0A7S3BQ59_9EUKA